MTLIDNDQFLVELGRLYQKSKTGSGSKSVSVTMKRYDGRTKPVSRNATCPPPPVNNEYKCLFRAASGAKKISTVVSPKEVNKFQLAYCNVLKLYLDNMKKRTAASHGSALSNKNKTKTTSRAGSKVI